MALRHVSLLVCGLMLAGCDLSDLWFGTSGDGDPLPGQRIAIMGLGKDLKRIRASRISRCACPSLI